MDLFGIGDSYKAAVDALGYKSIVGSGSTIYINDVEPGDGGKLSFDSRDEAELTAAVKFGPQEKIEAAVKRLTGKMSGAKVHLRQYQAYMLSVANCIVQLMQQYDLSLIHI